MRKYQLFGGTLFFFLLAFCLVGDLEATADIVHGGTNGTPIELEWQGWVTLTVFALTLFCLVKEVQPPDIVLLVSTGFLVILGVLSPQQFLSGFSNNIVMTIALLCIVVRAMELNGILGVIAQKTLSTSKVYWRQTLSFAFPVAFFSAFLNNTPIVLMMTPMIRKWAIGNQQSPSKFLLPLSYIAILGGMCTIIGTSTNVVIASLLRNYSPSSAIGFFELSLIGIPIFVLGFLYLIFVGRHLLPDRTDPVSSFSEHSKEFTAEFLVQEECPFVGKTITEAAKKYFSPDSLIRIERTFGLIDAPSKDMKILLGDRLVFTGGIDQIAKLHTVEGLQSEADPQFKLDVSSSHFSEVVLTTTSWFVGKTLKRVNFRRNYGASVVAVYRQGSHIKGDVGNIVLQAGDTLMLLSSEPWRGGGGSFSKNFFQIRINEPIAMLRPWRAVSIVCALVAMVVAATMGVSIMIAALATAFFLVATRSISIREAQRSIMWNVLLLIACSFGLATAMATTGVAGYFAQMILSVVGTDPHFLIGGILLVTIISTELLSNNATALLMFPIAMQVVQLAGYDSTVAIKTAGIAVAVGSSCGFSFPTGYQTHMIVYGQGGYRFTDFLRVGIFLDMLIFVLATFLIPYIWPLI